MSHTSILPIFLPVATCDLVVNKHLYMFNSFVFVNLLPLGSQRGSKVSLIQLWYTTYPLWAYAQTAGLSFSADCSLRLTAVVENYRHYIYVFTPTHFLVLHQRNSSHAIHLAFLVTVIYLKTSCFEIHTNWLIKGQYLTVRWQFLVLGQHPPPAKKSVLGLTLNCIWRRVENSLVTTAETVEYSDCISAEG